jgi:hypothetical protein
VARPVDRTAQVLDSFSEDFYILGIDIMIVANLQPIVLELNDRPSLKKEVFDAFSQISLDGMPLDVDESLPNWIWILLVQKDVPLTSINSPQEMALRIRSFDRMAGISL